MGRQPRVGDQPDAGHLAPVDGLGGFAVPGARAGLDLTDDEPGGVGGHQIELAVAAPPVARQDHETPLLEVGGR
jgi:hypothetical protein